MKAAGKPVHKEYKFRALLKASPFQNTYTFVTWDWGYLDKDGWESSNIQ